MQNEELRISMNVRQVRQACEAWARERMMTAAKDLNVAVTFQFVQADADLIGAEVTFSRKRVSPRKKVGE